MAEPASSGDAARGSRARRRIHSVSNLLVMVVTVAAALWGAWWLYDRLTNVYVLDARISADMLLLSSQVSGWIVEVPVAESAHVLAGDVLLRIDDRRARARRAEQQAAVAVLEANLETAAARMELVERRSLSQLAAARSKLDAVRSELATAQGDLEIAEAEWQRARRLQEAALLSQQQFEEVQNSYRSAVQTARRREAEIATAQADVAVAEADRAEVAVLRHELRALQERRGQAEQQLAQAQAELDDHTITSPINGVIDQLFVERGEHVSASQRVLVMHDPSRLWVKANVKETDLRHVAVGDRVAVRVDAYPDSRHSGVIRRVGDAATSQFALLPNPNPSGNFTKVTQRIEISIDLDEHDARLKPGMMVEVKIPRGS